MTSRCAVGRRALRRASQRMRMTACLSAMAALTLIGAVAAASDEADAASRANKLVAMAIDRYEASETYRMEFVQEAYWSLADSTQTSRGTLVVSNPYSISVRYADGGRIVVHAGSLRVYVPQTNQFFRGPVDSRDVVIDPPHLLRQYAPDPDTPLDERGDGTAVVLLRHRRNAQEPNRLAVEIDEQSGLVTEISARTSTGDRTTYRIVDTRFGQPVAPDEFTLTRPAGAELIEGGTR